MRHVSVILGHPISTGFRGLTGCQRDPQDRGATKIVLPSEYTMKLIMLNLVGRSIHRT